MSASLLGSVTLPASSPARNCGAACCCCCCCNDVSDDAVVGPLASLDGSLAKSPPLPAAPPLELKADASPAPLAGDVLLLLAALETPGALKALLPGPGADV